MRRAGSNSDRRNRDFATDVEMVSFASFGICLKQD